MSTMSCLSLGGGVYVVCVHFVEFSLYRIISVLGHLHQSFFIVIISIDLSINIRYSLLSFFLNLIEVQGHEHTPGG